MAKTVIPYWAPAAKDAGTSALNTAPKCQNHVENNFTHDHALQAQFITVT